MVRACPVTAATRGRERIVNQWQRLDPRLHLAAAIGWVVFTVVTLAALVAASLAAGETERHVRADSERLMTQFATQIRDALAISLETRRSVVQATAAQISVSGDSSDAALRRHLDAVQVQFPELAWLGITDERGRVTAATGGMLEGQDASAQAWFEQGRTRQFLGAVHQVGELEALLPRPADGQAPRFIDIAVPLIRTAGRPAGVLGAQLSWSWVERLQVELMESLDTRHRLELLLAAGNGTVLIGPPGWPGRPLPVHAVLSQDGVYVVGRVAGIKNAGAVVGWTIVVRQAALTALASARSTQRVVFLSVLLAGLAAAVASVWATRVLTQRLSRLASQALDVRSGALEALTVPAGKDEVSRISATLAEVVGQLQQEKHALQMLNAELDARVIERTTRIKRLADDARHAAVTRERLRLARDLHDTLAHSLMALLMQIRLVRKLRARWSTSELEAELAQIEEVAASGLTEARAAIAQMRHNDVRETGLGSALRELLGHFHERTGVNVTLQADPAADGLASERAETVFRIAEEALRNVERHARAQCIELHLGVAPAPDGGLGDAGAAQRWRLEITDDGAGFDPALPRPGHYGLSGIEEQAGLIGARFELISRPGQGTRIAVEFDA